MALDQPDDDFGGFGDFDRPGRQVPGGDVPARRPEPPESRSREEYYEVLRAASENETADDGRGAADGDRSGWDSVDAEDRPKAEDIHVTPERTSHILDGEPGGGGGHRHGVGKPIPSSSSTFGPSCCGTVRRRCVIVGFRWAWQEDTVSREERWTSPS